MNRWRWICLAELLALGVLWWWTIPADPVEIQLANDAGVASAPTPSPAELVPLPASAPQPAAAPALPPPAEASPLRAWTGAENRVALMCEVRDEDGNLVRKLSGTYAHALGEAAPLPISGQGPGRFVLTGLEPGTFRLALEALGMDAAEHSVIVADAPPIQRCVLRMQSSARVNVRIVTSQGARFFDWLKSTDAPRVDHPTLELSREAVPGDLLAYQDRSARPELGSIHFPSHWDDVAMPLGVDAQLHLEADPPLFVTAWLGRLRLGDARLAAGDREVQIRVDEEELRRRLGRLRCRFVDAESGAPLAGVKAHLSFDWGGGRTLTSDATGWVSFQDLIPDPMNLTVNLKGHAELERRLQIPSRTELDLGELRLTRPGLLRARVLDVDGQPFARGVYSMLPVAGAAVPQDSFRGRSSTTEEGWIELRIGAEAFQIVMSDARHGLQAFTWERGSAETEERTLRLRAGVRTRLLFEVPEGQRRLLWLLDGEGRLLRRPFHPEQEQEISACLCPGLHLLRVEDLDRNFIATLDLMVPDGGGDLEVSLP